MSHPADQPGVQDGEPAALARLAAVPATPNGEAPAVGRLMHDFQDLIGRLGRAGEELAERLTRTEPAAAPSSGAELMAFSGLMDSRLRGLEGRLEGIEAWLRTHEPPERSLDASPVPDRVADQQPAWAEQVLAEFRNGLQSLRELAPPPPSCAPPAPPPPPDVWPVALLGSALAADPALAACVAGVCEQLVAGDASAATFIGQILIYRHAAPERRPQLLKDLGEAYYRCFPKSEDVEDRFEQALVGWLHKTCEQAGFQNRIELVHPGERFDASRHTALEKGGVEVSQVHGWVVLRDPDKVYTRALVSVQ